MAGSVLADSTCRSSNVDLRPPMRHAAWLRQIRRGLARRSAPVRLGRIAMAWTKKQPEGVPVPVESVTLLRRRPGWCRSRPRRRDGVQTIRRPEDRGVRLAGHCECLGQTGAVRPRAADRVFDGYGRVWSAYLVEARESDMKKTSGPCRVKRVQTKLASPRRAAEWIYSEGLLGGVTRVAEGGSRANSDARTPVSACFMRRGATRRSPSPRPAARPAPRAGARKAALSQARCLGVARRASRGAAHRYRWAPAYARVGVD